MAGRGAKQGKKAAKTYERPGLSEEEIEEIKEAFNLFDTDGSGKYSYTLFTVYVHKVYGNEVIHSIFSICVVRNTSL